MGEDNLEEVMFLDGDELFGDNTQVEQPDSTKEVREPEKETPDKIEKTEKKEQPAEVQIGDDDSLFGDDDDQHEPETVGTENNETGKKVATTNGNGSSPKGFNAYSSFAKAMKGDNLFQFIDDDVIDKVNDADSFAEAMDAEINARLDDDVRRVKEALDAGVPADTVRQYEAVIQRLNDITEDQLSEETEQAAKLRQNIIYQDYINRGFSKERAAREVKRSVDSGNDIEDSKEALESAKQFYQDQYDDAVAEGKKAVEDEKKKVREEAAAFKKTIFEKEKIFGDIEVDKATRQKAYDAMTRIVGKDEDGTPVTAVQKFADENPAEFRSVLGIMWAMTDGFKSLGKIVQKDINKKVRSNLKDIENRVMSSTPRGGSPKFIGGEETQDETSRRGWRFDV